MERGRDKERERREEGMNRETEKESDGAIKRKMETKKGK